jgi:hypothetical protein
MVASWKLPLSEMPRSRTAPEKLTTGSFPVLELVPGGKATSQAAVPVALISRAPPYTVYSPPSSRGHQDALTMTWALVPCPFLS